MNYKKDLKKVMMLYPDVEVSSSDEFKHLINIHNILEASHGTANPDIVKLAFDDRDSIKLRNPNDYFYLVLKTVINTRGIQKIAYDNSDFMVESTPREFDIDKWASLVHKIYDAVSAGDMSLDNAIDYYSDTLGSKNEESEKFKQWMKYYQSGEHLKYNSSNNELTKVADFQFPLSGGGFYPSDVFTQVQEEKQDFQRQEQLKKQQDGKESYDDWKQKLHGAIRRIDKLLRQGDDYMSPEDGRELTELLHGFDLEVRTLRNINTASDRAFNVANKLKKLGFTKGSDILEKFAQEVPPVTDEAPMDLLGDEQENSLENEIPPQVQAPKEMAPSGSLEGALDSNKDSAVGQYNEIGNAGVSLEEASRKLEEIAASLSDRRVVRYLAEFDIMLDKIGIASMFPELAEAQSKLIDSYSYALTRVTKMLGMLSSGKGIAEISDAKKKELIGKTMKEVNKTFNGPEGESGENQTKSEVINQEFGNATPNPEIPEPIAPETEIEQAPPEVAPQPLPKEV